MRKKKFRFRSWDGLTLSKCYWESNIILGMYTGIRATKNKPNKYRQISNMRRTLIGNKIVDHSDEVRASPAGAAPTTISFSF